MNVQLIFFFAGILIAGSALWILIDRSRGGSHRLDVDKYRSRWLAIESSLKKDSSVATWSLAVINADKLLDQALRERGYAGNIMSERMKSALNQWSRKDMVWRAHHLRNKIAHDDDMKLSIDQAKTALASFKRALRYIGAI